MRTAIGERLASASWQACVGQAVVIGVLGGAYSSHLRGGSSIEMLRLAFLFAAFATLYVGVMLRVRLAPLWALPRSQRQEAIDAIRFERPLDNLSLCEPILRFSASATKAVGRVAIAVVTAFLGATAGFAAFVAILSGHSGRTFDAIPFSVVTIAVAAYAAVWPEYGRASRRKLAAAEHAAHSKLDASAALIAEEL